MSLITSPTDCLDPSRSTISHGVYSISLETKSAHSFYRMKTGTGGNHDVRLRGALHLFVDTDDDTDVYAKAIVGKRTMPVEPTED